MVALMTAPVAAADELSEYELVYAVAHAQLGDQWKHRARGPDRFDCTGLVWYAFHENDLQSHIGGYRSVSGYVKWFKERGLMSKTNPRLGDLVIWGNNQHAGIYIGDGMAISTLTTNRGVAIHPVKGYLGVKFKTYLRTQLTLPDAE
jgi:cell wall-associated NlpC family hydrolase